MHPDDAIVIVGIAGLFPGAETLAKFWENIRGGVDATTEVPADRWRMEPASAYDPKKAVADRVYSTRGGFIKTPRPDTTALDIDTALLERLDPVFRLAVTVAHEAWSDARTDRLDRRNVGIIFGNIVLPTETASALTRSFFERAMNAELGATGEAECPAFEPMNAFPAGLPAALAARALGLGGPAYTIDAACGSSLYALKLAVDLLRTRAVDAMICGGVSRPDPLYTQMGFAQLRALSARGKPAPFDEQGDGLVVGEGAGMFVLKRKADALAHDDTIYGEIAGIGISNDIHGDLLAPSSEGQLRAMRMAYEQAGWSPSDVDLIECHATGTPVGDAVEIESLRSLWGEKAESAAGCVIGSVKSNVGHALTAAGAAGLLKVLLALKYQVLPPTANFERPAAKLGLSDSTFRVLTGPEPWPRPQANRPRRAAISGFGFGGINCHVLIQEHDPTAGKRGRVAAQEAERSVPVAIVGRACHFGPLETWDFFADHVLGLSPAQPAQAPANSRFAAGGANASGYFIESLEFDISQFRIPPKELTEMLPQQSLMLRVAAEAIGVARWNAQKALRTGVLIGIGLDLNTTNYDLRWSLPARAVEWNETLGLHLNDAQLAEWTVALLRAAGPPLTANGTMGSLGGLIASRIAREFKIGGPSFTVSCDEVSGLQALAIAKGWLERGELDAVVVGAVDFAGDTRVMTARGTSQLVGPAAADGAVAFVLKRLDDAERDGDTIFAIVTDVDIAMRKKPHENGGARARRLSPASEPAQALARQEPRPPEISETGLGTAGAATGLASVAKAVASLERHVVPAAVADNLPTYWMRNRAQGPRRSVVHVQSAGGVHASVTLEEPARESRPSGPTASHRGATALFAIEADTEKALAERLDELTRMARERNGGDLHELARAWWLRQPNDSTRRFGLALVARSVDSLVEQISAARQSSARAQFAAAASAPPRVAFVYPGLGNHFAGMGRALAALWPQVLDRQDAESGYLRDQFDPEIWWREDAPRTFSDHREPILGSVALGALVTDVLGLFGVSPDAAIGYSLGESAALVALRAWTDRDELLIRVQTSPLFKTDLAGPCNAARAFWQIPPEEPVRWVAGIVPRTADAVRAAIGSRERVYVLIKNTPEETVIGGHRDSVAEVVRELQCPLIDLPTVSTVHCDIARSVADEYRALHDLDTTPPAGIDFYSAGWGRTYCLDRHQAADALTAQAIATVDFPALIERAYADGIRVFLETGPGASCTRMIGQILRGKPHVACSACRPDRDAELAILEVLAELIVHRVPVDLTPLYGGAASLSDLDHIKRSKDAKRIVRVPVRGAAVSVPAPPRGKVAALAVNGEGSRSNGVESYAAEPVRAALGLPPRPAFANALHEVERSTALAHQVFLRVAQGATELAAQQIAAQLHLIESFQTGIPTGIPPANHERNGATPPPAPPALSAHSDVAKPWLDRAGCLEFAVGSIGAVLGPEFAAVDQFPTRVRLPDEPLMLVDRIVSIEGRPLSLDKGRIVTEHVIEPDAWYLDAGRIAPCVAIEAGQADLFLCAYLGADFETRGRAVYRLLDATVTFHRDLPQAGAVIRYDIRISHFFRQGKTILFRFQFEGTVDGEPLLTMRDGCAGFFTQEELDAGKGIVARALEVPRKPTSQTEPARDLVPLGPGRLQETQLEALARGDLGAAFGAPFDRMAVRDPLTLPGGRMSLVHRVTSLEPAGGTFGRGFIRAEADIHPGDWFMVCHFVDDRVMPGTLMYECCLHTLRIFLLRLGWVGEAGKVAFEPVPGIANRLKCRGQIIESSKLVAYEITIKERGYRPEPYAIADALIVADGKAIVEVTDMALQLSGTNCAELERLWSTAQTTAQDDAQTGPAIFDHDRILEFAVGRPSAAFGEPYRPFDRDRFIARLPGPPYQFLDRITRIDAAPWVMAPGGKAEAQFDVLPDAWYFAADRQPRMPFAVLLEVALQACGWMAAYMGSALSSDQDLKFRNLGGAGRQHRPVTPHTGTLTTHIHVTKISKTAGMILQHFEFAVSSREGLVYDGNAEFGFFHPSALAQQVGIRDAAPYQASERELAQADAFPFPEGPPWPDERWRMIDRVDAIFSTGGPNGLGLVRGSTRVDPSAWFFSAHFLGDPVWPGSLGIESFLQLLKVAAAERWGVSSATLFESPGLGHDHRWTYRGQIVPTNQAVTVHAAILEFDDVARRVSADGLLEVDGKVIYQMNGFSVRVDRA